MPSSEVDLVLRDQLVVVGDGRLLVEAVVEHLELDLAAEQPAVGVQLVDPVLVALHARLGPVRHRTGQRQRHADHDGLVGVLVVAVALVGARQPARAAEQDEERREAAASSCRRRGWSETVGCDDLMMFSIRLSVSRCAMVCARLRGLESRVGLAVQARDDDVVRPVVVLDELLAGVVGDRSREQLARVLEHDPQPRASCANQSSGPADGRHLAARSVVPGVRTRSSCASGANRG